MFVPTNYFLQKLLENGEATVSSGDFAGVLSGAKIGLITDSISPTGQTAYSDLTPAAYTGYADQVAAFGGVYRRKEGGLAVLSAQLRFHEASTLSGVSATGIMVHDGGGTPKLLGVEMFEDGPKSMGDALDSIYVSAQIALGGPDWGRGEFSN